jgi:hypothetical protein
MVRVLQHLAIKKMLREKAQIIGLEGIFLERPKELKNDIKFETSFIRNLCRLGYMKIVDKE